MIERLLIVIVSIAAIIFVPYWIGWLLVKPRTVEDNVVSNWWIGIIILLFVVILLMVVKVLAIPYIIKGSV